MAQTAQPSHILGSNKGEEQALTTKEAGREAGRKNYPDMPDSTGLTQTKDNRSIRRCRISRRSSVNDEARNANVTRKQVFTVNTKKLSLSLSLVTAVGLLVVLSSYGADIRGKITSISSSDAANTGGSVLIEGAQENDTNVDKAATRITAKTQIFRLQDGKKVEKKFSALKVGQTVEATFAGPVAESYPVQGTAGEIVILAEAGTPDPDNEPVVKEGAEVSLTGELKGGMMGIGGESTGWVLGYQTKAGPRQIEVDCSGLDAAKIPKGAVRITGKVFKKNYRERGPTLILKATKIEMNRRA